MIASIRYDHLVGITNLIESHPLVFWKLNTEPSIGASHQVSVHLAKQLQRRRFLEIDQPKTRIDCGGHVC
jgi:hypothetical protein